MQNKKFFKKESQNARIHATVLQLSGIGGKSVGILPMSLANLVYP